MNRRVARVAVAVLATAALFSLAGCSSAQAPQPNPKSTQQGAKPAPAAAPAQGGSVLDPAKQAQEAADQMNKAVQQQNQQLASPGGP